MPKVKLESYRNTQYIIAPEFCPYSVKGLFGDSLNVSREPEEFLPGIKMDMETPLIHPSLCAICKFCTFVSRASLPEEAPTQADRDVFAEFLTHRNSKISASILAQKQFLGKGDRSMLVILLSPVLFQEMLEASVSDEDRRAKLFSYFFNEEVPVCSVLGCPVYVSRKLTKSPVQVVGEIEWR